MDLWSLLKLSFNEWMVILATSESPFRPFWRVERDEKNKSRVRERARYTFTISSLLTFPLRDPSCLFIIIIIIFNNFSISNEEMRMQ